MKFASIHISSLIFLVVTCLAIFWFYKTPDNVSKCLELEIGMKKKEVLNIMGEPMLRSRSELYSYKSRFLSSCTVDLYFHQVEGVKRLRHKFCDSGKNQEICLE